MDFLTFVAVLLASAWSGACDNSAISDVDPASNIASAEPAKEKEDRAALFGHPQILPVPLLNPLGFHQQIPQAPLQVIPSLHPSLGDRLVGSVGGSKPNCKTNGPFCLHNDNYPRDQIGQIVSRHYEDVRNMHASLHRIPFNDLLHHDNTTHRFREGGHFVCESQVQYIRPGWARNIRGEWMAIINTDRFPQVVRVEQCKYASRRCEYLPPCYKSTCIQRFSLEKLLCVDPKRSSDKPIVDVFEIPTACSCFVESLYF